MAQPAANLAVDELTVDERLDLLGRLWDSLLDAGPPPMPAWHREVIRERIAAIYADPGGWISLEELRQELQGGRP